MAGDRGVKATDDPQLMAGDRGVKANDDPAISKNKTNPRKKNSPHGSLDIESISGTDNLSATNLQSQGIFCT